MAYSPPAIRASGQTFTQLKAGGLVGQVEALITANATATAAPTAAPTAAATGGGATGGLLAAGTYFIKFTETNGVGETTASPESTQLTVSATNIPRITFATLKTGNTARNLYLTAAGGASGTEKLFAAGITATTYDVATAAPASTVVPPTANTTAITADQVDRIRRTMHGSTLRRIQHDLGNWLSGLNIATADINQFLEDGGVALSILKTAIDEIGVLVVANAGTVASTTNANSGLLETRRTWP